MQRNTPALLGMSPRSAQRTLRNVLDLVKESVELIAALNLFRAAVPIDFQRAVFAHCHGHHKRHGIVGETVAVNLVREPIGTRRPSGDLRAGHAFRIIEQRVEIRP